MGLGRGFLLQNLAAIEALPVFFTLIAGDQPGAAVRAARRLFHERLSDQYTPAQQGFPRHGWSSVDSEEAARNREFDKYGPASG